MSEITLPQTLHFIQREYKRYEKERIEWGINKCELQSEIDRLKKECENKENENNTLKRQIKMLEFAIKERPNETTTKEWLVDKEEQEKPKIPTPQNKATEKAKETLLKFINQYESITKAFKSYDFVQLEREMKERAQVEFDETSPAEETNDNRSSTIVLINPKSTINHEDGVISFSSLDDSDEDEKTFKSSQPTESAKLKSKKLGELGKITLVDEGVDNTTEVKEHSKQWKPKATLRSHLDTVRSLDYHPTRNVCLSGSDDGTIKLWNLEGISSSSKIQPDMEPIFTYRRHMMPVCSVVFSHSNSNHFFSAGHEGQIHKWKLYDVSNSPYSPYETSVYLESYEGHSDIIWNMNSHPTLPFLASCSADGTVKLWKTDQESQLLKHSFTHANSQSVPTAVDFYQNSLIVSYNDASISIYDIETGSTISTITNNEPDAINCLVTHPVLPVFVTGHESRAIKFHSITEAKTTHSMVAHLDAINTLDFHNSGLTLVSGANDSSIRFWDCEKKTCTQEFTAHRKKHGEAILCVKYHRILPFLISSGGDSTIKLYV